MDLTSQTVGTSLFLDRPAYSLEKEAAVRLGADDKEWEEELSQALHKEHPYIQDHQINVTMNKTDAENGVGIGAIQIDDKVVIPIIVDKFKVAPFDVFWHENKLHPLSKTSLNAVLQNTQIGKPVTPGQGEASDISLYSRAQPPFDGKYSYASAERLNDAMKEVGAELLAYETQMNPRFAEAIEGCTKVALARGPVVKTATKTWDDVKVRAFCPFQKLAGAGAYEIATAAGVSESFVFDRVMAMGGEMRDRTGLAIGLEKAAGYAYLREGQDVAVRELTQNRSIPASGMPKTAERGVFFTVQDGVAICSDPLDAVQAADDEWIMRDGANQPWRVSKEAGLKVPAFAEKTAAFPESWAWLPIGGAVTPLDVTAANHREVPVGPAGRITKVGASMVVRDIEGFPGEAEAPAVVRSRLGDVIGPDKAGVLIDAVEKLGEVHISITKPGTTKSCPADCPEPRNLLKEAAYIRESDEIRFPIGGGQTIKIAAVTESEANRTVDALLGLNFLNPENMVKFTEAVDEMEMAKETTAKLLVASRLGLEIDSRPLRTAMFALDSVERDLRELRHATETGEDDD